MTDKNTTPATVWEVLRRLLKCNKQQLAARLGVTRQTLRIWEEMTGRGEPISDNARRAATELLTATLRAADNTDDLLRNRHAGL
jgi:DNA-binding transcriptional regulator YiaG